MTDKTKQIAEHRKAIDTLDAQMLALLNERAAHAKAIGQCKGETLALRPERVAQVLSAIAEQNKGPLPTEAAQRVFNEIMSACLALEQPMSVAFLGPEGTYSELAAHKHFGKSAEFSPCTSIDDVFRAVESGGQDIGIVPVENSTEGAIGLTLDLLLQTPLKVCGEVVLRIHHNLMTRSGTLAGVKKVYSHSQSLGQCNRWLAQHAPQLERIAVFSNAEAARLVAEQPDACAIASEAAAARFGLKIVNANIEDESNNTTRFLVIGKLDVEASGRDKTSLVMAVKNVAGAVHALLTPLAENGVSMNKIESRPARHALWEYMFYVDIEGHPSQPHVAKALDELQKRAAYLKVLGSYPAAVCS